MSEQKSTPPNSHELSPENTVSNVYMRQRNALGIPEELKGRPVLYMSTHRGAFNIARRGHLKAFQRILNGEDSGVGDEEKESVFLDLTQSTPEELVSTLRKFVERAAVLRQEANRLSAPGVENMRPPGFIANIIYLPGLDQEGKVVGCTPTTFAINADNYRYMLPELKQLLEEQNILARRSALTDMTGKSESEAAPALGSDDATNRS